jgi:hypothetical protein
VSVILDRPRRKLKPEHFRAQLYFSLWTHPDVEISTREPIGKDQHEVRVKILFDGCPMRGKVFDRARGGEPIQEGECLDWFTFPVVQDEVILVELRDW